VLGEIAIDWGAALLTFTLVVAIVPPILAETDTVPTDLARSTPAELTLPTDASLLVHLTCAVSSFDVPFESVTEAVSCCVCPTERATLPGWMLIRVAGAPEEIWLGPPQEETKTANMVKIINRDKHFVRL
jgi:hypothetical protein